MDVHPPSKVQDFFHPPYCIYRYVYPIISPFFMVSPTLITIFSHTSTGFWSIATTCKSHCCCCWWFPPYRLLISFWILLVAHDGNDFGEQSGIDTAQCPNWFATDWLVSCDRSVPTIACFYFRWTDSTGTMENIRGCTTHVLVCESPTLRTVYYVQVEC